MTDTTTARALTLALCSASLLTACGGGGGASDLANAVDGAVHTLAGAASAQAGAPDGPGAPAPAPPHQAPMRGAVHNTHVAAAAGAA